MANLQLIAAEYAEQGLAVIPIGFMSKQAAVAWRAFQWSPPTASEVETMFSNGEHLNLGIVCGAPSRNLAVFDAETKSALNETIKRFEDAGLADTWIVESGRGGHVHCRLPQPVKPLRNKLVEVRGQGQYVLAPPSLHPSGSPYSFINRSPSICEVPSFETITWLKLEPAQRHNPLDLPRRAIQLLRGKGRYHSRSEMEHAIVTRLVNSGFTFEQILRVFLSNPAAGKFREIYQGDPMRATQWLRRSFQKAREWCARESPARQLAREALGYATASCRDLAEIAGCERKTASRATRRLCGTGLLRVIQRSTYSYANRYELAVTDLKMSDLVPLTQRTCEGVGHTSAFQLPDAFRQRGLGRTAYEVLAALEIGPLSVKLISQRTGRHVQTVRAALSRLRAVGLVRKERRLWVSSNSLAKVDMLALAVQVGTAGALQKQRQKHKTERLHRMVSNSILRATKIVKLPN